MKCWTFTQDQLNWFLNRITTSNTGRIIIPTYLRRKFRKLTNDFESGKYDIIQEFLNWENGNYNNINIVKEIK